MVLWHRNVFRITGTLGIHQTPVDPPYERPQMPPVMFFSFKFEHVIGKESSCRAGTLDAMMLTLGVRDVDNLFIGKITDDECPNPYLSYMMF